MATQPTEQMVETLSRRAGTEVGDGDGDGEFSGRMTVRNVGGIDECEVAFEPGITILTGQNATNRTSFLTALNGVLGGTGPTLKSDADRGRVELSFVADGPTFTREYRREGDGVRTAGEPFCEDAALVDTFVTLVEGNAAREAVERGGENVRDVLMEPVDVDAIEREIRQLSETRDRLDDEIRELERELERGPELVERQEALQEELAALEREIEETREEMEAADRPALDDEGETAMAELDERRAELRELADERDLLDAELEGIEEEQRDLYDEAADLVDGTESEASVPSFEAFVDGELPWDDVPIEGQELESEISRVQGERDQLERSIDDLTRVRRFVESLLERESDVLAQFQTDADVPAALDPDSREIECPTCGSDVEEAAVREQANELEGLVADKREEMAALESRLSGLQERQAELRRQRRERERIGSRIEELARREAELERNREEVADRIEAAENAVESLEETVDRLLAEDDAAETAVVDLSEQLTTLEYERGQKETERATVETRLEELEAKRERLADLEDELAETKEEIADRRETVEGMERQVVDLFNEHMDDVLDVLGYANLQRVWLERKTSGPRESVPTGEFELHIVRETDGGSVYEDTVDTLSESEREVVGLITALAGYLTHDVEGLVPFVLLDSVEAIDADRLVTLVEHFADHSLFLFVALLPEDAAAFPGQYARVTADVLASDG